MLLHFTIPRGSPRPSLRAAGWQRLYARCILTALPQHWSRCLKLKNTLNLRWPSICAPLIEVVSISDMTLAYIYLQHACLPFLQGQGLALSETLATMSIPAFSPAIEHTRNSAGKRLCAPFIVLCFNVRQNQQRQFIVFVGLAGNGEEWKSPNNHVATNALGVFIVFGFSLSASDLKF